MPLYVHNLPSHLYSLALQSLIEPYWRIRNVEEREGYAYVEMYDEGVCRDVIARCDGAPFRGATIRVRFIDNDNEIIPHHDIALNFKCQGCNGVGHTPDECPTSRRRAIAAMRALDQNLERRRGITGDTNTSNFSLHSRHRSAEMWMEQRPPMRRPLSGDLLDHQMIRGHSSHLDANLYSFDNRSAHDRPIQRDFPMSSRSDIHLDMNRDQRGLPTGPRNQNSSTRFNNQYTQNRSGRRSSTQDHRSTSREFRPREFRPRSRTPPPRRLPKRNGPLPRPFGDEGRNRTVIKGLSRSRTVHTPEDRATRRSNSPPKYPRKFRGPRTPSPDRN
ncbi:hypothetical protein BC943DRAFT_325927 [Umbelopsis sp. AD052]|nr:hypothetical protein BC943DRAFT_325927 [Umbelopsis sp. AD052]